MRGTLRGLAAAAIAAGTLAGATQAHAADPTWTVAQTNTITGDDGINVIAVAPNGSSWAGGYRYVDGKPFPVVQRLTGQTWTTTTAPADAVGDIKALDASSATNVWAFGGGSLGAHWNGTTWTSTTMPAGYFVSDTKVVGPKNVWTVGGDDATYAAHWTGSAWKKVALPAPARAIGGAPGSPIYAAGTYKQQAAVMQWTGSKWKLLHTPKLQLPDPSATVVLNDVYAPAADNVYAAGGIEWACGEDGDTTCTWPLLLHYDGTSWKSTLLDQSAVDSFAQVAPDGSGGVWLLQGKWDPTLVHDTAGTITTVTAPRPSGYDTNLTALATTGTTVWAGGAAFPGGDPDDPTGSGIYLRTGGSS